MDWSEKIFRYCERGSDPSFWAEPVNAVTNGAFIIAAILASRALLEKPPGSRGPFECLLVALIFAMGLGSFLFHTFATRWASLADSAPIAVFMLAYFAFALRRLAGLSLATTTLSLAGFAATLYAAEHSPCPQALMNGANGACLNGSLSYLPALAAMAMIGVLLAWRAPPAAPYLASAAAVFFISLTFRTIDGSVCAAARLGSHPIGTHFLWHILNAIVLYLLAMAAIQHGGREPRLEAAVARR